MAAGRRPGRSRRSRGARKGFAVDEVSQGLRLPAQRADQMMIIDRVAARADHPHHVMRMTGSGPRKHSSRSSKERTSILPPISRTRRIEDLIDIDRAVHVTFAVTATDGVVDAGQRFQRLALHGNRPGAASVVTVAPRRRGSSSSEKPASSAAWSRRI